MDILILKSCGSFMYLFFTFMFFRIVFFFTLILSNLYLNGQDPVSILQKAEKVSQQIPSYSEIEIISERPRYSRKIKLRNWSLNNNYSIVEISSPKRDSGMVYMKTGKKLFTYSPKTDRIIKLPSSMLAQGWMGTDAQFDNILGAASLSKDFNHELKLPVDVNNESCHFIRCVPLPETAVAHDHIDAFINKQNGTISRLEVYNKKGALIQQIDFLEYKMIDGIQLPVSLKFSAKKGTQNTELKILSWKKKPGLKQAFFTESTMKNLGP
jgi:hypothetical protein